MAGYRGGYRFLSGKPRTCGACVCLTCGSHDCPWDVGHKLWPANASCARCAFTEGFPLAECPSYRLRRMPYSYGIRLRRKNKAYALAQLLERAYNILVRNDNMRSL